MEIALFTLVIPSEAYANFVRDWLSTEMSFWKNVKVRHIRMGRKNNLCEVRVSIVASQTTVDFFEENVFGRYGILTKMGWLGAFCFKM